MKTYTQEKAIAGGMEWLRENYLKYGQKFPPTQMTYDQTSNNVAAINQRND